MMLQTKSTGESPLVVFNIRPETGWTHGKEADSVIQAAPRCVHDGWTTYASEVEEGLRDLSKAVPQRAQ